MAVRSTGGLTEAVASGIYSSQETPRRQPMGKRGWPSPVTRRCPGPDRAIKPKLVENVDTLDI
ncbi:MAG: hypothetical protein OXI96_04805 [Acidimicrobiaceae bacterium]|nr:hypothetical protein [Acidimicrobiaceae bacterium]